ncbi:putative inactive tyrosine-protein kinase Wsck [Artemia franciscana]
MMEIRFVFLVLFIFNTVLTEPGELVGCFVKTSNSSIYSKDIGRNFKIVEECVIACTKEYYSDAALSNGDACFCFSMPNLKVLPSDACNIRCEGNNSQICGGERAYSVYRTGISISGPPARLSLTGRTESSLLIEWESPNAPNGDIRGYSVAAFFIFQDASDNPPLSWSFDNTTFKSDLNGLQPAKQYNISVSAVTENGPGIPNSAIYTTDIHSLKPPLPPAIIGSSPGEIVLRLNEISDPAVSSYQLIVANDNVKDIDENKLFAKLEAESEKVPYYVTAAILPSNFTEEFIVGDGKIYGGFFNSPLADDRGYLFSLAAVVSIDGISKHFFSPLTSAPPKVEVEDVVVAESSQETVQFESKAIDDYEASEFERELSRINEQDNNFRQRVRIRPPSHLEPLPPIMIGLICAIAVGGVLLLLSIVTYFYMRQKVRRGGLGAVSQQRLTFNGSIMEMDSNFVNNAFGNASEPVDQLGSLTERATTYNRNAFSVGDCIGKGKFGMIHRGTVSKETSLSDVVLYVIKDKEQDPVSKEEMLQHLSTLVRVGHHFNIASLVGICEETGMLFIITESYADPLKEVLLASRTLSKYPTYAEKEKRFSTLHEAQLIDVAIGVARGMAYLSSLKIIHRRLCARNIMIADDFVPKITGFTPEHPQTLLDKPDYRRWLAPETLRSLLHPPKSDTWSFGVLLWEIFTLGGTPYAEVRSQDVPNRVIRGLRLTQPSNISDDLFQIMLQCWQIDLDERPALSDLVEILSHAFDQAREYVTFDLTPNFKYEPYQTDKEFNR